MARLALALGALLALLACIGCVSGTTPDCGPGSGCEPTTPHEAGVDTGVDTGVVDSGADTAAPDAGPKDASSG